MLGRVLVLRWVHRLLDFTVFEFFACTHYVSDDYGCAFGFCVDYIFELDFTV